LIILHSFPYWYLDIGGEDTANEGLFDVGAILDIGVEDTANWGEE
jgi:hypothetical protein